jgi:hypothetical protein
VLQHLQQQVPNLKQTAIEFAGPAKIPNSPGKDTPQRHDVYTVVVCLQKVRDVNGPIRLWKKSSAVIINPKVPLRLLKDLESVYLTGKAGTIFMFSSSMATAASRIIGDAGTADYLKFFIRVPHSDSVYPTCFTHLILTREMHNIKVKIDEDQKFVHSVIVLSTVPLHKCKPGTSNKVTMLEFWTKGLVIKTDAVLHVQMLTDIGPISTLYNCLYDDLSCRVSRARCALKTDCGFGTTTLPQEAIIAWANRIWQGQPYSHQITAGFKCYDFSGDLYNFLMNGKQLSSIEKTMKNRQFRPTPITPAEKRHANGSRTYHPKLKCPQSMTHNYRSRVTKRQKVSSKRNNTELVAIQPVFEFCH